MIMLHMDFNATSQPPSEHFHKCSVKHEIHMCYKQLNPWFTPKNVLNIKQKNLKQHLTKHQHYIVTVNHLIHPITTHNIEMSCEESLKSILTNKNKNKTNS